MEVRALSTGFYGGARRREGEVFNVKDGEKAKWFEPVDPKPAKGSRAKADKVEAKADKVEAKVEAEAADLA